MGVLWHLLRACQADAQAAFATWGRPEGCDAALRLSRKLLNADEDNLVRVSRGWLKGKAPRVTMSAPFPQNLSSAISICGKLCSLTNKRTKHVANRLVCFARTKAFRCRVLAFGLLTATIPS